MAVLALLPDFSILIAWWQRERVAYGDFRGPQPFHREVPIYRLELRRMFHPPIIMPFWGAKREIPVYISPWFWLEP